MRADGSYTALSCARYTLIEGERTIVWMYPTLKPENASLLHLCINEDQDSYYELFVENQAGKTIARHRAYSQPEETASALP